MTTNEEQNHEESVRTNKNNEASISKNSNNICDTQKSIFLTDFILEQDVVDAEILWYLNILDLKLTLDPQVCNVCSKIIISSYNFRCRSMANQEIIEQYKKSNNLEFVSLQNMMRPHKDTSEVPFNSISRPYYEIFDTEVVEISVKETNHTEVSYHKTKDAVSMATKQEFYCLDDEIPAEECTIEEDIKCDIQNNQVESTSDKKEEAREEVSMDWFPKSDYSIIKQEPQVSREKCDDRSEKRIKQKRKKVKVEIMSDVPVNCLKIKFPKKTTSIKSEIKNYSTQNSEMNEGLSQGFKCFQCDGVCLTQQDLTDHIKDFHAKRFKPEGKFTCELCGNGFRQKVHVDGHLLNKHSDEPNVLKLVSHKVHFCDHCPYKTINNFNLKNHLQIKHNKSFGKKVCLNKCPYCSYISRNQGNFKTHLKCHNDACAFPCCYCGSRFAQKVNLNAHYLNHHQAEMGDSINEIITNQIYTCEKCEWRTMFKDNYLKHISKCCGRGIVKRKRKVKAELLQKDIAYEIVS